MDTANLTDDQVVNNAAAILVMPSARVRQLLDEVGYFGMRDHARDEIQAKKAGPAERSRMTESGATSVMTGTITTRRTKAKKK